MKDFVKKGMEMGVKRGGVKEKKEKSNKTHVKIRYEALMTAKKKLEGGNFSGWPEYIPLFSKTWTTLQL